MHHLHHHRGGGAVGTREQQQHHGDDGGPKNANKSGAAATTTLRHRRFLLVVALAVIVCTTTLFMIFFSTASSPPQMTVLDSSSEKKAQHINKPHPTQLPLSEQPQQQQEQQEGASTTSQQQGADIVADPNNNNGPSSPKSTNAEGQVIYSAREMVGMCSVTEEIDETLLARIQRMVPASDGTLCVKHLERIHPKLPLAGVDMACPINQRRWSTIHEHIGHIDWIEIQKRKRKAVKLYKSGCLGKRREHNQGIFIDIGPKTYSKGRGGSIDWFLKGYPGGKNFLVHAYDKDQTHKREFENVHNVFFHNKVAWNDTGYVTFVFDFPFVGAGALPPNPATTEAPQGPPSFGDGDHNRQHRRTTPPQITPTPPPTNEDGSPASDDGGENAEERNAQQAIHSILNMRKQPAFFHYYSSGFDVNEAMRNKRTADGGTDGSSGAIRSRIDPRRVLTVEAQALSSILLQETKKEDIVVMKMDAAGYEWMLIDHLIDSGTFHLVDELMLVCHNVELDPMWPTDVTPHDCRVLINTLRAGGIYVHEWY